MASVINPQYTNGTNLREWPLDVTEDLIRRRRFYKEEFYTTRLRDQAELWLQISLFIYNTKEEVNKLIFHLKRIIKEPKLLVSLT